MNAIKGIYTNGSIELIEKPVFQNPVEVLIVFPKSEKKVTRLRGLCNDDNIDYEQIERDLKELNRKSEEHLLSEWSETK